MGYCISICLFTMGDDIESTFCRALAPGGHHGFRKRRPGVHGHRQHQGMAVQVDHTKPTSKASRSKPLRLKYDKLLSRFASDFNLRRYTKAGWRKLRPRQPVLKLKHEATAFKFCFQCSIFNLPSPAPLTPRWVMGLCVLRPFQPELKAPGSSSWIIETKVNRNYFQVVHA